MKMLIVDDDVSILKMIETACDWKKLGIDVLLQANSGISAINVIKEESPDIILCDIEMPQGDGMGVLRWISEQEICVEFLFLTAHASFEYAREAIHYGANNYLTKPFTTEELEDAVRLAIHRSKERMETKHENQRQYVNLLISNICKGTFGDNLDEIQRQLKRSNADFLATDQFYIVYVMVNVETVPNYDKWNARMLSYGIRHLALELIANKLSMELVVDRWDSEMNYVVTLFIPEDSVTEGDLFNRCKKFIDFCQDKHYGKPICLVNKAVSFFKTYSCCIEMNKILHQYRFSWGQTITYRQWNEPNKSVIQQIDGKYIQQCLQKKKKTELIEYIGKLAGYAIREDIQGDWLFHQLHQDLLQIFFVCLHEKNIEAHAVFANESIRERNQNAERSVMDMMRFVDVFYENYLVLEKRLQTPVTIASSVKQYIEKHFRENISREEIAAAVYITPNYLSKLFRNETGMTLREYINLCRIREAKHLLSHTELSISDIAMEIGFENMSYFSTVFKKMCGISPLSWKNGK